jgi:hypothetical protein
VQRSNHQWSPPNLVPTSYFAAVESLAAKRGWRLEQHGGKFYLRSIEVPEFRPRDHVLSPLNHLAFFDSLGEVHEFLTMSD